MVSNQLQAEYEALLKEYGLKRTVDVLGQERLRQFFLTDYADEVRTDTQLPASLEDDVLQGNLDQAVNRVLENFKNNPIVLLDDTATKLGEEVERDIQATNQPFAQKVFAGEFPTGSFNAQVVPSASGYLVLINTGLMMFIYQTLKVMVYSAFGEKLTFESNRKDSEWANVALAEIILAYLIFRDPRFAKRLPAPGGLKSILLSDFVHHCEKFSVAHEYGHILGSHLENASRFTLATSTGDLEVIRKSWLHEYEADTIAASLMLQSSPKPIESDDDFMALKFIVSGPLIFFSLDNLITQSASLITKSIKLKAITDHPPSHLRINNLAMFFEKVTHTTEALRIYKDFTSWLSLREPEVLRLIGEFVSGHPKGPLVRLAKVLEILSMV